MLFITTVMFKYDGVRRLGENYFFMRVPNINRLLILMIAVSTISFASAQEFTAESKNAAISNIARNIASNYVYPEKGGQIASHIQAANFNGKFSEATNWKEFDEMVTKELREFSGDGHLYVKNDPAMVAELKNPSSSAEQSNTGDHSSSAKTTIAEVKVIDNNIGYLKLTSININKNNVDDL